MSKGQRGHRRQKAAIANKGVAVIRARSSQELQALAAQQKAQPQPAPVTVLSMPTRGYEPKRVGEPFGFTGKVGRVTRRFVRIYADGKRCLIERRQISPDVVGQLALGDTISCTATAQEDNPELLALAVLSVVHEPQPARYDGKLYGPHKLVCGSVVSIAPHYVLVNSYENEQMVIEKWMFEPHELAKLVKGDDINCMAQRRADDDHWQATVISKVNFNPGRDWKRLKPQPHQQAAE